MAGPEGPALLTKLQLLRFALWHMQLFQQRAFFVDSRNKKSGHEKTGTFEQVPVDFCYAMMALSVLCV